MSAESTGLLQSPEHKRQRSTPKKPETPLKESIRRCLDLAMESARTPLSSLTRGNAGSFDSLDEALQQMETITNDANNRSIQLLAPGQQSGLPDPESHYTACPSTDAKMDNNAPSSPGWAPKS
jgi:hypothetical protein